MSSPFDTWLDRAWNDHATDSPGVAARIVPDGLLLARSAEDLRALVRLAHHVLGEHLGHYAQGREILGRIGGHECIDAATRDDLLPFDASLALCEGVPPPAALSPSARVRVLALAAGNLAERDSARCRTLLEQAVKSARDAALTDADPACRSLAVAGNGIACAMEECRTRTSAQRELMLQAARIGREFWGRAGTWLQVERAEYRLALSHLQAGEPSTALQHAEQCLQIVREQDAPALEWYFGYEALARAQQAVGRAEAAAQSVQQMRHHFEHLKEDERAWCRPALERLGG